MSMSICYQCGTTKLEPSRPCPKCHATPTTEDELAVSMALTDTLMSSDELTGIATTIAAGKPYHLEPEQRTRMIMAIRKSGRFTKVTRATDVNDRPRKRPWWKLWS